MSDSKINPAEDIFSAPQPKGDKFEVVVTNPAGQEVTRKEFDTPNDGRQWARELTSAAAAKTAGTSLAPHPGRNDGLTDYEANPKTRGKSRLSL